MKHTAKIITSLLLIFAMLFCIVSCGGKKPAEGLWASATYTEDTTLGEGSKTITVEVTAEEKTVVFTVKTDADTVGAALLEHNLIAGDQGDYGLYVKTVNGITADYDKNQTWWGFYVDGAPAAAGVDSTDLVDGSTYGFKVEK